MKIDYIRAYAAGADTPSPAAPASSPIPSNAAAPQPAADLGGGGPKDLASASQGEVAYVNGGTYWGGAADHAIVLTGWRQTVHGGDGGVTFYSTNNANDLYGGSGDDTFVIGRGGDHVAGGSGHDVFRYAETPWAPSHIADFTPGQDSLDLTGLLARSGYAGGDPVAGGYLKVQAGAAGGTEVLSNLDHVAPGSGWWVVAHLDGVAASDIHVNGGWLT